MTDQNKPKEEPGAGWTLLVIAVFVGVPLAIGGLVYVIHRVFFTAPELAVFAFRNNEAGGEIDAPSAETLHFELDAECDEQMRSSEFGDQLERAQITVRIEDDGNAVQTVTCGAYENVAADTHSREMRRRPKLDGIPLECELSLRRPGVVTVKATASWNGARVRAAVLRVTQ